MPIWIATRARSTRETDRVGPSRSTLLLRELGGGLDVVEGDDGGLAHGSVQQVGDGVPFRIVEDADELNDACSQAFDLGVLRQHVLGEREHLVGGERHCLRAADQIVSGDGCGRKKRLQRRCRVLFSVVRNYHVLYSPFLFRGNRRRYCTNRTNRISISPGDRFGIDDFADRTPVSTHDTHEAGRQYSILQYSVLTKQVASIRYSRCGS